MMTTRPATTKKGAALTNWLSPATLVATSLEEMFAKVKERDAMHPAIAEYSTVEGCSGPQPLVFLGSRFQVSAKVMNEPTSARYTM